MKRIKDGLMKVIVQSAALIMAGSGCLFAQTPASDTDSRQTRPRHPERQLPQATLKRDSKRERPNRSWSCKPATTISSARRGWSSVPTVACSRPEPFAAARSNFGTPPPGASCAISPVANRARWVCLPLLPSVRDSRLVAAAAGENTVKIWDVTSGREVQTLTAGEAGIASSLVGVYFIAFSSNDRIVTISDAIRVWDVTIGDSLVTVATDSLNALALTGGDGGAP